MDNSVSAIHVLGELLSGHATPVVVPGRLAPSAVYDLQYRTAVVAAAFEFHAKPYGIDKRRIHAGKLKLLQFIASRPGLMPMVQQWSDSQGDAQLSLAASQRLRRGFLSDLMHDDVIAFLAARGILVESGSHLVSEAGKGFLHEFYTATAEQGLFVSERVTLEKLRGIQITNVMLEGW